MIGINLFHVIISTTIIATHQTIHRLSQKLDGDITSLEGGGPIHLQLTFIDSSAAESILEIETEQWVHD